jgi:catechol 2,3-dioxygenase-like lactoylglutathione lyase family enzyme
MEIYRIDHISQVVPDLEAQLELLEGLFGFHRIQTWQHPTEGAEGARLAVPGTWGHHWEVLSPTRNDSPFQTFLDDKGGRPGLHHVAVEVPDMEAVAAELEIREIKATGGAAGEWVEASLSPPDHGPGFLFRLRGPGAHSMCGDDGKVSYAGTSRYEAPSIGIVGIDHICQAFSDRDALAAWYADLAGFVEVWRTPDDEHPDMADLVLNVPGSSICWEVIMPWGDDSFIQRFWDKNGAMVHHVTFEVADWDAALAACEHHEIEPFDSNEGTTDGAAWRDTFIHPKVTGGVLVQIFWEERPGVWVRSDKIPPLR